MLKVINAGSTELSRSGGDNGILLNCWEKSSPLIKELERTVNFAERKCGDLMQQLNFYKEYYEKWAQVERVTYNNICQKKKTKKCCRQPHEVESSSENEFEKVNQYFYRKIRNKITEMNQEITEANRKISVKNDKVTPREKSPPKDNLPPERRDVDEIPNLVGNKECKSEPLVTLSNLGSEASVSQPDKNKLKVTKKQSSKSVPSRNKTSKGDLGSTKRRHSSLQRYKIRSKSLPQGVRRKFGFGGFFEVFDPHYTSAESINSRSKSRISLKAESFKSWKSRKSGKSVVKSKTRSSDLNKSRKSTPKSSRHRLSKSKSDIKHSTQSTRNYFSKNIGEKGEPPTGKNTNEGQQLKVLNTPQKERKETNSCKAIIPSRSSEDVDSKFQFDFPQNIRYLMAKPNALLPFLRQPIPFIPCSSTSKTFNLGLNVQQVLSLIKRKRHSVTLQTIVKNGMQATRSITHKPEPTVSTLFFSQTTTSHNQVTSSICPVREASEDSFSIITDNCRSKCSILKQVAATRTQAIKNNTMEVAGGEAKLEERIEIKKFDRPEDVWVVEQPDSRDARKGQSRCTCFPSKHCVDYHKVLRQYTGWRLPTDKGRSFPSDAHYSPMITCTKSKLFAIPSRENVDCTVGENDGKIELLKVHNDLINLNRKYSYLQEMISQNSLDDYEANAELDAMESELAIREVEFKDIMNFYNQMMVLKEKLKSLRLRNGQSQAEAQHPQCQRPKRDPLRPTPSMALTKVLRKIQGLQDKIKLIDSP